MLSVIMLSVIMLSVITLSVIMLSVLAPFLDPIKAFISLPVVSNIKVHIQNTSYELLKTIFKSLAHYLKSNLNISGYLLRVKELP